MEEVTAVSEVQEEVTDFETVTNIPEFTSEPLESTQYSNDSMLAEVLMYEKQSAECLTSINALFAVVFIFLVGKFVYGIFKGIFS